MVSRLRSKLSFANVVSLIALYGFATFLTARGALNLGQASTIKSATGEPIAGFAGPRPQCVRFEQVVRAAQRIEIRGDSGTASIRIVV